MAHHEISSKAEVHWLLIDAKHVLFLYVSKLLHVNCSLLFHSAEHKSVICVWRWYHTPFASNL